jgi:hypothetical protein
MIVQIVKSTRLLIFAFITVIQSNSVVKAEYNPEKMAEATAEYLYIIAQMEYLASSKCSYIIKKTYNTEKAIKDAESHFGSNDKVEYNKLVTRSQLLADAEADIEKYFKGGLSDGLDQQTLCGLYVGMVSNILHEVESNYNDAVGRYSK